uniref:SH2 domain-containing protein n=1 Tax=Timema tahoe TaxID=61484 RepID=A0A7R9NXR7_9NEOP|nr:unnamed protein product [Timema tahoe]
MFLNRLYNHSSLSLTWNISQHPAMFLNRLDIHSTLNLTWNISQHPAMFLNRVDDHSTLSLTWNISQHPAMFLNRRQGKVNHCRIRSKQDKGQTKYYLIDTNCFDSLYSLITHYRNHPLRSQEFLITLQEPVPQPNKHEGKEWYHPQTTRAQAEEMLKKVPSDGAFLVRPSEKDAYSYAISFRAEKKIKHCRIKLEGRLYTIGTVQFESLVELVSYYERHPLYRKIKLWYAVNEDVLRRMGMKENDGETVTEAAPAIDNWEEVTPDPAISYVVFVSVDEDVAVCSEVTDADIVAKVLNNNIQAEDGASGDEEDNSSVF